MRKLVILYKQMRIAIIGPTHPYKGGIAQHTTELANRLKSAGHDVKLISWKSQYPFFYPGKQFVPDDQPEVPLFKETVRVLSWKNPIGWWTHARQLKKYDKVVFAWWVPKIQAFPYRVMLRAIGKKGPEIIFVCHNVLAHDGKKGNKLTAKRVLKKANRLIVHSESQAKDALSLTQTQPLILTMPLATHILPSQTPYVVRGRLLFFGFVRPYKGLDILLEALAKMTIIQLIVVGEFWEPAQKYQKLIDKLGLSKRVELRQGYVSAEDLGRLILACDGVVLPYRTGTASWNVAMAQAYQRPVIVTKAGSLAERVTDGINGLICKPNDIDSLAQAIKMFYVPGIAAKLQQHIVPPDTDGEWKKYTDGVIGVGSQDDLPV